MFDKSEDRYPVLARSCVYKQRWLAIETRRELDYTELLFVDMMWNSPNLVL